MEITVYKERENTTTTVLFSGKTILELLHQLKINPETVLVVRKSEVITEKETVEDKDRIDILSVISGG